MAHTATDRGAVRTQDTHAVFDASPSPDPRRARFYRAFGLGVSSELELPELMPSSDTRAEVHIGFGDPADALDLEEESFIDVTSARALFRWKGVGTFCVTDGRRIDVWPDPGVERAVIRMALLGVVFGALLTQRSLHVLHASAVVIDGAAVCFAAFKGGGKSTMATALLMRGHHVMADDAGVVTFDDAGVPYLLPGYPRLNVWPYAADVLGLDSRAIPTLHSTGIKRGLRLDDQFLESRIPLAAIYLLERGEQPALEAVGKLDAFFALVPHCYRARYMSDDEATPALLLETCSLLTNRIPIVRLRTRDPVRDAARAAELIEDDLRKRRTPHIHTSS